MNETRRWSDGGTITRRQAEAEGLDWSNVCLYTDPVTGACEECHTEGGHKMDCSRRLVGVTPRHTEPCGCGVPNLSAYTYTVRISWRDVPSVRSDVRIYRCVKHRVDPADFDAVRGMFEFDHSDRWVIDDVKCEASRLSVRGDDLTATFTTIASLDEAHLASERGDDLGVSLPGFATITEAAAAPVEVDIRLRSQSEEEDTILRHFRGSLHDGSNCRACAEQQYERRITDRRVAECNAEIGRLRTMLNSIIEGP